MINQRSVPVLERGGMIFARVPREVVWELVEYLSCQRARVNYSFVAESFTVYFLSSGQAAAQSLLNDWAGSDRENRPQANEGNHQRNQLVGMRHFDSLFKGEPEGTLQCL
jgi:hypothetical protein